MSLPGDRYPTTSASDDLKGPGGVIGTRRTDGLSGQSTPKRHADGAPLPASLSLPLRLSVSQGGLGIELSYPLTLGIVQVETFEVGLLGVKYPVDLSAGVKQFRNRRSRLVRAGVTLELEGLGQHWAAALSTFWGERAEVRVGVAPRSVEPSEGAAVHAQRGVEALSVSVLSPRAALSFDLVIASGAEPCLVLDAPRTWGDLPVVLADTPTRLALRVLDALLDGLLPEPCVRRIGRTVECSGLAEALAMAVCPGLGCRLPEVRDQVIVELGVERGRLCIHLGVWGEPFAATGRSMRVLSAARALCQGDVAQGAGDLVRARQEYMEVLRTAPGHPDALLELAELDLSGVGRAESALSFLQELRARQGDATSRPSRARAELAWSAVLAQIGNAEASQEALRSASDLEPDSALSALFCFELSRFAGAPHKRKALLDEALRRAPFLPKIRQERLRLSLSLGDEKTARCDAQQLEAVAADDSGRARVCFEVGSAYLEAGLVDIAKPWFQRALRFQPFDIEVKVQLAKGLALSGEHLRSLELLSAALRDVERQLLKCAPTDALASRSLEHLTAQKAEVHFELANGLLALENNVTGALVHLACIPTRSRHGASARLKEAALLDQVGRIQERDRTVLRVLEAVELGWLTGAQVTPELEPLLHSVQRDGDQALLGFARRVLQTSA